MFEDDKPGRPIRKQSSEPDTADDTLDGDLTETASDAASHIDDPVASSPNQPTRRSRWRLIRSAIWVFLVLLLFYYPVGMLIVHKVDDDLDFRPASELIPPGGSQAVAIAAGLMQREINENGWIPNDPWFLPSAALDNMPNFQLGLKQALFRLAIELTDQIGRTRGSSQADPDLESAAGELKFPGQVWVWNPGLSFLPTASSEAHYRVAVEKLRDYNTRLSEGNAVFDRRADNLLATIDRIAADLGSASAEIDEHIAQHSGLFDLRADDVFFNIKGRLYGYTMILTALGEDFGQLIAERQLEAVWGHMIESMQIASTLDPLLILNTAPDGMSASHLTAQGFYLLRARTQLREVSNILLK